MNENQYQRVLEACRKVGRVGCGDWGVEYNSAKAAWDLEFADEPCCALGALLLCEGGAREDGFASRAAGRVLGDVPVAMVTAFTDAFDGQPYLPEEHDLDWYQAGVRMEKQLREEGILVG